MKFSEFISGEYKKQYQYKSFTPVKINTEWSWDDPSINTMLEQATQAISELNAFSFIVPNVDIFISMHITVEANKSSRIEGTQTTVDEAVMDKELIIPEKRDDWQEVHNYIDAINSAIKELDNLPLSIRLLKNTHEKLLTGARGDHKLPGEIRASQNWIGGTSLKDAVFIPPHHEELPELLSDLEKFWHNEEINVPNLIRAAISHYQFETLHPFLDGNGRIGRLLITLYLLHCGMLKRPVLYLSDYLEKHKGAYYDALTVVRSSNNISHWIKFFLKAVIETAHKGKNTFTNILSLKNELDIMIVKSGRRAEHMQKLVEILYRQPIIQPAEIAKKLGITPKTANLLISYLEENNILHEATGFRRNRVYIFGKYLSLF